MSETKNKIRAIFLLIVFSLNTLAGFACSVGLNLNYNSSHHRHDYNTHIKSNDHDSKLQHKHSHSDHDMHKRDEQGKDEGDCCANEVTKFAQLDKSVSNYFQFHAPVFIKIIPHIYALSLQPMQGISVNSYFQFVRRCCSLDDTDIRIAIQSFQI